MTKARLIRQAFAQSNLLHERLCCHLHFNGFRFGLLRLRQMEIEHPIFQRHLPVFFFDIRNFSFDLVLCCRFANIDRRCPIRDDHGFFAIGYW
jgi:hypothetical protein